MAKKRTGPTTLTSTLDEVMARLKPASQLPRPLEPPTHADIILAKKPRFPSIEGYRTVATYPGVGLRVNKHLDRKLVAIQFTEDRKASRDEKDQLTAFHSRGFSFRNEERQWVRPTAEGETFGGNILDAIRIAETIASARTPGRGR